MKNKITNFIFIAIVFIGIIPANCMEEVYTINSTIEQYLIDIAKIINENPDSAQKIAYRGIELAEKTNNSEAKATFLRNIGLTWYYKVDYTKALDYFTKSMELYQTINNLDGEASALSNISLVYQEQGFLDKSIEMEKKVLEMRKQVGDSLMLASGYNNMAVVYMDLKETDRALQLYQKAISIMNKASLTDGLDLYYNNIADIYLQKNKLDSAFSYAKKSLHYSIKSANKQMIANSYVYLGQYYQEKEDITQAIRYFEKGLSIFKEIGIVYEIEWAAKYLHHAYALIEEYEKAYHTHILYKSLADSARNIDIIQKITRTEAELEYDKERAMNKVIQNNLQLENKLELNKQKQARNTAYFIGLIILLTSAILYRNYRRKIEANQSLTQQKEEIEKQKNEIEALNKTKDKFFAILAHDLRNPVGGVFKLSDIVYTKHETMDSEKLRTYLLSIKNSSEKVYELLNNLLKWASLQNGTIKKNTEQINLNQIILNNHDLLNGLSLQKRIKLKHYPTENALVQSDQKMINIVVRNLMTNAIKFTHENGLVSTRINEQENDWKISITDTGIGISEEEQQLLFDVSMQAKKIGDSTEKGVGLGLILCKEYVELCGGEIWAESKLNEGSTFHFTIPKLKSLSTPIK